MTDTGRGKPLLSWCIYLSDAPPQWLGTVEAATVEGAVKVASEKFGEELERLIAFAAASDP
jgi:hypothetical protein